MPTYQFNFLPSKYHYKILVICTLISMASFFDFMAFWYSTNTIATLFFPKDLNAFRHSFYIVLIFGSGYLARPLGAILFGRYGDRKGRKPALIASFIGVTFFTLIIGLLPTYEYIGILATILFALARIGQGMTFGSQLPTLWVYLTEQLPINSIGMACGIVTAGSILSGVILIVLVWFLDNNLTQRELFDYGWRLPFLIGSALGLLLIFFTKNINETPIFLNKKTTENSHTTLQSTSTISKSSLSKSSKKWQGLLPAIILSWFVSSIVIIFVFFLTDLINLTFFVDDNILAIAFLMGLLFLSVGCAFFGFLTDRFNGGQVLIIGSIFFIASLFGLFYDLRYNGSFILLSFALTGFFAGVIGATPVVMVRLCPVRHRLTTLSLGYNISYALSGAFVPILLGFLTYHADFAPAIYLSFVCIITMFLGFHIYYSPRSKEAIEN